MKSEFAFRHPTVVLLKHVNHRKQFHGDDTVQAIDLTMFLDLPNTFLDQIQPELREALYFNADGDNGQEDVPGIPATLPNLRFPKLNGGVFTVMSKKDVFAGYEVTVEYGLGDDLSNMAFDCCKVKLQRIEVKEGGTVRPTFQVSYAGDRADGETIGKLIEQEGGEITITLIPPAVEVPAEPETPMENPFPVQGRDPDLTAGDIFGSALDEESGFLGGGDAAFADMPD